MLSKLRFLIIVFPPQSDHSINEKSLPKGGGTKGGRNTGAAVLLMEQLLGCDQNTFKKCVQRIIHPFPDGKLLASPGLPVFYHRVKNVQSAC